MSNHLVLLGKNIASQRKKAGLNQEQFADLLKVTQPTVSSWELGKIDVPYETICRIAEKLKTSPAALADPSIPIEESLEELRLKAVRLLLNADRDDIEIVLTNLQGAANATNTGKKRKTSAG